MMIAAPKRIYVLSDTHRLNKFANVPIVRGKCGTYMTPVSEERRCMEYIKNKMNHPYNVIGVSMDDLRGHITKDTYLCVMKSMYCSLNDKRDYADVEYIDIHCNSAVAL